MIFENFSQSNVFVTGENLARGRYDLEEKKKVKLYFKGKKAINFFENQSSFFFF